MFNLGAKIFLTPHFDRGISADPGNYYFAYLEWAFGLFQEPVNDPFIFLRSKSAGRIQQHSAGFQQMARGHENSPLFLHHLPDLARTPVTECLGLVGLE